MKSPNATAVLLGIAAVVIWGASAVATVFAVEDIDAATVGIFRTELAALIAIPLALLLRLPLPVGHAGWIALLVAALGGFVGFTILFSIGLQRTSTAHAALLLAASPIFTGLFGFLLYRSWPRSIWWLGAAVALAGEVLLILSRSGGSSRSVASLDGDLLVLLSILCSSAGYVAGGESAKAIGSWPTTLWGISIAGVLLVPVLAIRWGNTDWSAVSTSGWVGVIYLAIGSSIVGYVLWYRAIGMAGVARIAPLQFAMPLVTLVIALILLDERITTEILVAMVVILAGMALTRKG